MLIRRLFIGAAFASAIAVTAFFTSFSASSANAAGAGAGNFAIERSIPNYLLRWENPLLPPTPMMPLPGQ